MPADPATLFFVLVITSATGTLLLTWCWLQNSAERTLLWTAAAYAGVAIGSFLFAGRGIIPDRLSIDAANAFSMLGMALAWAAGRAFNGRRVPLWVPAVGPLIWIIACQFPAFYASFPTRVVLSSTLLAIYAVLTAREFAQRDGLLGRVPVVAMFVVHAVFVALRIPLTLAVADDLPGVYQAAWFGMAALEAIVFSQVIAVLMVSLTKERVEKRLNAAALTDALTGLANRRALLERGGCGGRDRTPDGGVPGVLRGRGWLRRGLHDVGRRRRLARRTPRHRAAAVGRRPGALCGQARRRRPDPLRGGRRGRVNAATTAPAGSRTSAPGPPASGRRRSARPRG